MTSLKTLLCIVLVSISVQLTHGSSTLPLSTAELVQGSDAAFRGVVVGKASFKDSDGLIYTRTSLRVDESFKGTLPAIVQVIHRGGHVGFEGDYFDLSPALLRGHGYLLFVVRGPNGKLQSTQGTASAFHLLPLPGGSQFAEPAQGLLAELRSMTSQGQLPGADVTDQTGTADGFSTEATTGMLNNVNSRFLQPDRGEPIPYLIDADSWPAGITLTQATNAVREAFDAWTAVTSLKFKFEGIQSFGQGADAVATNDEKIRIQLHDNYNRISTSTTLGIGGRGTLSNSIPGVGWNVGGNVAGNEFQKSGRGYVVLEATNTTMQTLLTFTEVLCHEIGHALNMAHSSEVTTTDPVLTNSIMYYLVHKDGRGATLGSYDPPIIQQVYPSNTPPFSFNRVIDVTSAPATPNVAGINEIEFRGYDLQNTPLTVATNGGTTLNGSFALTATKIKYTPAGYFADSNREDPDTSGIFFSKDRIAVRFSDGTNGSPYSWLRVISLRGEATATPDGIPDYWMVNFFTHATPMAGDLSRATDDADGDKRNTLQEYIAGMNPRDATSAQRITSITPDSLQFQARAYELYEIQASTNLLTWDLFKPVLPTTTSGAIRTNLPQTNIIATVSDLPPTNSYLFFRVMKVP